MIDFTELLKINWGTLSTIVSSLALIALILTLLEMRKQRIYSYKPYLLINQSFIKIKNDNYLKPFIWIDNTEEKENEYDIFYYLELRNIGLSTAKNIHLKWIIDKNEIDRRFKEKLNGNGLSNREEYKNRIYYKYLEYGFILDDVEEEKIPFLSSNKSIRIKLSESIKAYLSFYPILLWKEKKEFRYLFKEEIPLLLKLTYQDISNKFHHKNLKIEADLYVDGKRAEKENDIAVIGKITVNEI